MSRKEIVETTICRPFTGISESWFLAVGIFENHLSKRIFNRVEIFLRFLSGWLGVIPVVNIKSSKGQEEVS